MNLILVSFCPGLLYLDRNSLTGSLEEVCTLPSFRDENVTGHLAADCGVVTDVATAASSFEVNCTCCMFCCTDGTDDGCHANDFVPSSDLYYENGFGRPDFVFSNTTILEPPE